MLRRSEAADSRNAADKIIGSPKHQPPLISDGVDAPGQIMPADSNVVTSLI